MKKTLLHFMCGVSALACIFLMSTSTAFAYLAAPYSATDQPTFVTEKSMRINGLVNPSEMVDTDEWFEWGISGRSEVYETTHQRVSGGNMQIAVSADLIGLAPSTQYFYRQISENGRGKSIGTTAYGTTKPLINQISPIALISSFDPTFVDETGVTMRGYVSPHGNQTTKTWFEWGETPATEKQTQRTGSGGDSHYVEVRMENLLPGTMYYYRAVAENSQGRTYGVVKYVVTKGTQAPVSVSGTPTASSLADSFKSKDVESTNIAGLNTRYTPVHQIAINTWQWPSWGVSQEQNTQGGATVGSNKTGNSNTNGGSNNSSAPKTWKWPFWGNATASGEMSGSGDSKTSSETAQLAGVGSALHSVDTTHMLSGKKPVEVAVMKVGPKDITPHIPVEYIIAYAYHRSTPATNAQLKIVLPSDVVYTGDNSSKKLVIEKGNFSTLRTYSLALGDMKNGDAGRFSILGMTTGEATHFSDANVILEFTDASGHHAISADDAGLVSANNNNSASVGMSSWSILPSNLFGWLLYILFIALLIIGVRKSKEYYKKRKEKLRQEDSTHTQEDAPVFFPGEDIGTLQQV